MIQQLKKLVFLVLIITAIACEKDDAIDSEVTIPTIETPFLEGFSDNFGAEITRSFIGTIIDNNRQPIDGVQVTIGSSTAITDTNGIFIIDDATVNERFAYIKASKIGYIHGSRALVPTLGANKVTIMLLEETVVGTTTSGTSETISLSNGASVSLNGEYIKEDGSPYQGTVDVILHHLDPVDPEVNEQMPGMLYAANANGEERLLQTLGMLAVELRGTNGEDINLADGTTAEIRIPLDASLMDSAPSIIPLWYFDEERGFWVEDGEATLIGNEYVGTVTHFSFWNCDIPAGAISLCITITSQDGDPLSNTYVGITSENYGTRYGITNSLGIVCGLVPHNESLIVSGGLNCSAGDTIFSENIGPFTSDTNIEITPTYSEANEETITGIFTNCDGDLITNGYVEVTHGGNQYVDLVQDGTYEINFIRCSEDEVFTINAVDNDTFQSSGEINYTFTSPITNLTTISSCDEIIQFITYQIDDNPTISYLSITQAFDDPNLFLSGSSEDGAISFAIANITNSESELLTIFLEDANGDSIDPPLGDTLNMTLNVTSVGEYEEYIDANFSGTYTNISDNTTHTLDGAIHIIRYF